MFKIGIDVAHVLTHTLLTVISGALTLLQQDFNMSNTEKELVVGGTTFGAIFGGFFSGLVSLYYVFGKQDLTLNQKAH